MKRCIACGAPLWETPLLTLDNMPASAQHMPDAEHVGADKGLTLDLCQCSGCGLVQFDCEPVDYYRDVIRAGGYSTTMAELRRKQYKHLIDIWSAMQRNGELPEEYTFDGIHLKAAGYAVWIEKIRPYVK